MQLVFQYCRKTSWMASCTFYPPHSNLSRNKLGCCRSTRYFSKPATTWFVSRQVWFVGGKRVKSLFISFCGNVAKQAASFFPHLLLLLGYTGFSQQSSYLCSFVVVLNVTFSFLLFINSSCSLWRDRASLQELLWNPYEQSRRNENGHLVIGATFNGTTKAL